MSGLSAYHHPGSCEDYPEQDPFGLIGDGLNPDDTTGNNVTLTPRINVTIPTTKPVQDEAEHQFTGTGNDGYYYEEEHNDLQHGREP